MALPFFLVPTFVGKEKKMAHVTHYHRGSVAEILHHNSRTENYSNRDIDASRSKYNYSLSGHENDFSYYTQRLSEVHCMKRANVCTLSSWVVTLPSGVPQDQHKLFFAETVNFLKSRYGAENCVSADVHYDETTPHLHFTFIPVVFDEKKQREKVSRKELFTLKELYSFHEDLEKHLQEKLGKNIKIRTGNTEKNISVRELKQKTAQNCTEIVQNAKQEAESILSKATEEKRNIEQFFAIESETVKKYQLSKHEYDKAAELDFKATNGELKLPWVPVPRKLVSKLVRGYAHLQAVEETTKAIGEKAKELKSTHYDMVQMQETLSRKHLENEQAWARVRELEKRLEKYEPQVQERKQEKSKKRGFSR